MRAIEIAEPGKIQTVERPKPTPGPGEVLLKVLTVGYCGTDLSTFRGANPLVSYPRVPGHEIAGEVAELGEGVTGWEVGEQALVFPYTSCGACASCRANRPNCCQHNQTLGVQREGALAEFAVLPADKLMRGAGLSPRDLALVEPLTVGAHAAARGEVTDKDTVAVFGCGAIGLGAIAAAHRRGARVVAIDVDDRKLAIGKACGADACVNSREQDLAAALGAEDGGRGPSVVIEAVGLQETFRAAVDLVAFAGRVVYVGYAKQPVEYETKFFVMKELDIRGSRNALPEDFENVIRMLADGAFPVEQVISRETSIDDAPAAMQEWNEKPGAVTKIHVRVG